MSLFFVEVKKNMSTAHKSAVTTAEGDIFQQMHLKCCCVVVYQWKLLDLTFTTSLCETLSCKLVFIPNVISIGRDY